MIAKYDLLIDHSEMADCFFKFNRLFIVAVTAKKRG